MQGKSYINGAQWLKSQAYLKWDVASRVVNNSIVTELHIRKDVIPCVGCLDLYIHNMCMTIQLTTSVRPSIWGWKEVDLVSLVSNNDHNLDQNVLRKLIS